MYLVLSMIWYKKRPIRLVLCRILIELGHLFLWDESSRINRTKSSICYSLSLGRVHELNSIKIRQEQAYKYTVTEGSAKAICDR